MTTLEVAYQEGVKLAMQHAGLAKEAGASGEEALRALSELGGSAGRKIKSYFTAKPVREALMGIREARAKQLAELMERRSVLPHDVSLFPGAARDISPEAAESLARSVNRRSIFNPEMAEQRSALLKSLVPYAVPVGAAGLGYGAHKGLQALYPDM